ncbi:MAG TPA: prepilin peptidase, partial [Desulfovibrio sp.]|nr:prepilin peptidase [Desulfovibrio sp.]
MHLISINIFQLVAAGLFGAVLGSFYGCCVFRYINGQTLTNPRRSTCPNCGHTIRWYENIPLLSYFMLGGKCSDCKQKISPMYAVIESVSVAWAVLLMLTFGPTIQWLMYMFFGGLMIVASF